MRRYRTHLTLLLVLLALLLQLAVAWPLAADDGPRVWASVARKAGMESALAW